MQGLARGEAWAPTCKSGAWMRAIVNGKTVECGPGASILEALRAAGAAVPTLCHDDRMAPAGVCRLCLVAVSGWPRPVDAERWGALSGTRHPQACAPGTRCDGCDHDGTLHAEGIVGRCRSPRPAELRQSIDQGDLNALRRSPTESLME